MLKVEQFPLDCSRTVIPCIRGVIDVGDPGGRQRGARRASGPTLWRRECSTVRHDDQQKHKKVVKYDMTTKKVVQENTINHVLHTKTQT